MTVSMKNMDPKLKKFIEDVNALLKMEKDEHIITEKIAEYMEVLILDDVIPELYKRPNPDKYTLYPVYISPDNSFSIASAVWDVGQSTPIHDHGTWGVIGIIEGEEREVHYELPIPGSKPKKLIERKLGKGEVIVCCTSDQDVHEVHCASSVPCVGLHVYGGNIGEIERHVYDSETGEVTKVVTAWDEVPDDKVS